MPSHGMYRVEFDAQPLAIERSISDLVGACIRRLPTVACMAITVRAGPRIELGTDFVIVTDNKVNSTYSVRDGISQSAIEVLTSLPYGEFFVLGCASVASLVLSPSITDLDDTMTSVSANTEWAIGYDAESAIVTVLARDRSVAMGVVLDVLGNAI